MASSRKYCASCGKNFGKSAYYVHLPCKYETQAKTGEEDSKEYVFCDHCNKRVAKKTFRDHQRMEQNIIYSRTEVPNNSEATQCLPSFRTDLHCESVQALDSDENEDNTILEEEDEAFFSDSDQPDSDQPDTTVEMDNDSFGNVENEEEFEHCDDDNEELQDIHQCSRVSLESKAIILFFMLWQTLYKVSDRGMIILFNFIQYFLKVIGKLANCEAIVQFAQTLPQTMYMAKAFLGFGDDDFEKFVVCPGCMTIYKAEECTETKSNGRIVSKRCSHITYPNHPQKSRRRQCGKLLMKQMRSKTGTLFLHPKKLYCFKKLSSSIKSLIIRPGFIDKCESWRKRELLDNSMGDVFEGKVWKEFLDADGTSYFSSPSNFGVMLNVDWFQPYKHTNHSVGVLYLVLMNLPREERFKQENVIIVGIIPGPKEPKGNINSFLQPLVDELIDFWDGVIVNDKHLPGGMLKVRVALLALSCDVPAARKCGGFAGHSANKGCNKCFKSFPCESFGSKLDFSGFDVDSWEKRTNNLHRIHAESALYANCPTQLKTIIRNTGAKYTVLLQLPYYDAVRFVVIDPMHNLFLGLAKNMMKIWKKSNILTDKEFVVLQKRVNDVVPPPEVGRIPTKISTGFSGFTADQWKNWVCYYSVFALKGILPKEHYDVWTQFVNACRLICCKVVTTEQCSQAESNIIKFCKMFQKLYCADKCTPNMHLSCHLVECIRDYGPVYSFWCFSFERYNGILGSYHKNNNNIGIQLMRKFLRDNELLKMEFPLEYKEFKDLLTGNQIGTCGEMLQGEQMVDRPNLVYGEPSAGNFIFNGNQSDFITPYSPIKRIALDEEDSSYLVNMYQRLYPECEIVSALRICDSFSRLQMGGKIFRCSKTSGIMAKWFDDEVRPGKVCRFLNHDVVIKQGNGKRRKMTHVLAEIKWLRGHPEKCWYPSQVEVWSSSAEDPSELSFVPVLRFHSQCIIVKFGVRFSHGKENVNVVVPYWKILNH